MVSFGIFGAGFTAGYADGRIGYISNDPGDAGDFAGVSGDETKTAWAVRGGVWAKVTPTLGAYVDASWTTVDSHSGDLDYDYWAVVADLQWTPVAGLLMGPEIAYISLEPDNGADTNQWGVMWRIERDLLTVSA